MRRMIAQGMSQNPGNQYKAVPVVKMPSPAFLSEWHLYDQLQLHPSLIPARWLQIRWGYTLRDLWNFTAHSVLLLITAANMESKYLEIKGY